MPLKNDEKPNAGLSLPEPTLVRALAQTNRQWFGLRRRVLNWDVKACRKKLSELMRSGESIHLQRNHNRHPVEATSIT
jgi:hypothetical protein